jgi:hypothetical protein
MAGANPVKINAVEAAIAEILVILVMSSPRFVQIPHMEIRRSLIHSWPSLSPG